MTDKEKFDLIRRAVKNGIYDYKRKISWGRVVYTDKGLCATHDICFYEDVNFPLSEYGKTWVIKGEKIVEENK